MNFGKQPLKKDLKCRLPRGEKMLKDVTENGTTVRSLQYSMAIGKKDQDYLEVPIERHKTRQSCSLLPLDSGESTPGHWICFLMLNTFNPRQAPETQSDSKEFKVKAHPGRN